MKSIRSLFRRPNKGKQNVEGNVSSRSKQDEEAHLKTEEAPLEIEEASLQIKEVCACLKVTLETARRIGGHQLHANGSALASHSQCHICNFIKTQLNAVLERFPTLGNASVSLVPHKDMDKLWIRSMNLKLKALQLYAHPGILLATYCCGVDNLTYISELFASRIEIPLLPTVINSKELGLLKEAIENCLHGCKTCSGHSSDIEYQGQYLPPSLPKRVIDVSGIVSGGKLVYLYESKAEERAHYIALSHRWGRGVQLTSRKANIAEHQEGRHLETFPKTFQDAINVAAAIGIKYLWVDALCIIQDDPSDWLYHSTLMGDIFRNSTCTVAIHSANNSEAGFLTPRDDPVDIVQLCNYQDDDLSGGTLHIGPLRSFDEALKSSHIIRRAWVQQELILSPRIAHISGPLIFWECPHTASPTPLGLSGEPSVDEYSILKSSKKSPVAFEEAWLKFVTRYSRCEITYESDRVVAIEGIGRTWEKKFLEPHVGRYFQGHYEKSIKNLLWFLEDGSKKTKRAPSWSWTSVEGPIDFLSAGKIRNKAEIVCMNKTYPGNPQSDSPSEDGAMEKGLVLTASKYSVLVGGDTTNFGASDEFAIVSSARCTGYIGSDFIGTVTLDKRMRPTTPIDCLHLASYGEGLTRQSKETMVILLIERDPKSKGWYRRIGLGLMYASFKDLRTAGPETFCII